MQANPFQVIPKLIFPSLIKLPPVHRSLSPPPTKPPRAISISTPGETNHAPIISSTVDVVDDSVAAFWDYQFLFVSQRSEQTEPITLRVVEGSVPPDFPSGTYYLTGPGLFSDDHGSTVHPLDGHGYLRAFHFYGFGGEVKFMAKYVKTEAQVEEHDPTTDRWRFTHRGPFSVLKGGQKVGNTKVMKNVANTCVLRWGRKLLCLWEGGNPYEIESETLDTVGKVSLMEGCDSGMESGDGGGGGGGGGMWDVAARLLKPILYGTCSMNFHSKPENSKYDTNID